MNALFLRTLAIVPWLLVAGCNESTDATVKVTRPNKDPYPSTYVVPDNKTFAILHANILTGDGAELRNTDLLISDGKIAARGTNLDLDDSVLRIDATGKWVTPGLIDVHSHMGVYSAPGTDNHSDGNEMTSPVTAQVWAEHSVWPGDPQFEKALAGGVTTVQILPGAGNLIGGRGVTLKNIPSTTVLGM
jgi:imidazolonepropionase-like amidohydrolase